MRRIDRERNDAGGGRGFRVLDPGGSGRYLEPLTPPPPPRAPEPYKVAPPSSSLGRAHRRSSFVIIAETRPATPSSRSPSPTLLLATGRVSPFRGRGFKGPLPHAQSRPQSPENHQQGGRRQGRYDRRTSVSQQSSPKRSLIPQPTRRRSVSLTKANERKPSPKFGRRAAAAVPAASRKNSNLGNGGSFTGDNVSRRQSLKAPDLSPIQGTPTKPVDASGRVRGGNSLNTKVSPLKTRNTLTVPKNVGNPRRTTSQERSPSKALANPKRFVEEKKPNGENGTPTKIPIRRGSIINKNGSTQSLSASRIPGKPGKAGKPGDRVAKGKNDVKQNSNWKLNENHALRVAATRDDRKDEKKESNDPPGSRFIDISSPPELRKHEEDLGLIDLLKQSSGATGTSSVVNTTTTTAVQPLQIEAVGILLENDRAKTAEEAGSSKNSTPLPSPASLDVSPAPAASPTTSKETSSLAKSPKLTNGHQETGGSEKKSETRENEVGSSMITSTSNNANQKNSSSKGTASDESTSTANSSNNKKDANLATISKDKTNKEQGNHAGNNGAAKKSLPSRNGHQEASRSEAKLPSANLGSRVNNSNNNHNSNNNSNSNNNNSSSSTERNGSAKQTNTVNESVETSGKLLVGTMVDGGSSLTSGHQKSDSKGSARSVSSNGPGNGDAAKRTQARNVGGAVNTGKMESSVNSGVRATGNGEDGKMRGNHGSESSLKSSNGLSTKSVDSIRSTDTGVSVNTVRGVSSAREKKGMHMMKKSEEIETLSGNLMHLERNGEPTVLDITEAPEDHPQPEQTRIGRFKKSLTSFYERLPGMRCLGCRRNQKGHPWPGERREPPVQQPELPANGANANTGNGRFHRVWTNLKNACRCMRLRECKCCRRAARVAPAESTPCCPPERRCGALCRRLFSRCKCCNRSEAQHTRSIRAKHSLTSVAPPPLSEEQRAKIPEVLVEHNSVMRGAIPCLPVPLAWFCLVWNVLLPGSGTVWSGLFNLCVGQPRFSISASPRARFGALVVNTIVGVSQFFTVLFCLVGWGWSIWWGVTMIRLARKYKRFRASEAANGDAEARGGEPTGLPPGVPSQALRGMERAR